MDFYGIWTSKEVEYECGNKVGDEHAMGNVIIDETGVPPPLSKKHTFTHCF